jgi:hypothetical protein
VPGLVCGGSDIEAWRIDALWFLISRTQDPQHALPGTQRLAQTFEYLPLGLCDLSIHSTPQNLCRSPRERPQIFICPVSVTQALGVRPPEMVMAIPAFF